MDAEEVKAAHDELQAALSKILWDFSDKHSTDNRSEGHQAFFIIQSVLCDASSSIEYQIGRMAPFTYRQNDHICYQIGDWYLAWKNRMWVDNEPNVHFLGTAKEQLKLMICGE